MLPYTALEELLLFAVHLTAALVLIRFMGSEACILLLHKPYIWYAVIEMGPYNLITILPGMGLT